MSMLKEALKRFRKNAAARLPWMAKTQLPMIFEFEATIGEAGRYNHDGTITIYASAAIRSTPDKLVKTMAHEMGHHLWALLGGKAKDYWSEAIYGDYGDLDIRELLAKWPGDMWAYEFAEYLADKDPILSLQLDAVWPGYAGRHRELAKKEDFEDLLGEGTTTMPTPNNPITGYANKNPEEAFCEAVGMMVAYGPRTVLPQVRKWLNMTIPGELRVARVVARYLEGAVGRGVVLLMDGMQFRVTKPGDKVLDVVGIPGRRPRGHEGQKFFVYVKGYEDDRTYTLTPASSKGVPGFMEGDESRKFRGDEVTVLMPRAAAE
jgi:hypothetical protein